MGQPAIIRHHRAPGGGVVSGGIVSRLTRSADPGPFTSHVITRARRAAAISPDMPLYPSLPPPLAIISRRTVRDYNILGIPTNLKQKTGQVSVLHCFHTRCFIPTNPPTPAYGRSSMALRSSVDLSRVLVDEPPIWQHFHGRGRRRVIKKVGGRQHGGAKALFTGRVCGVAKLAHRSR